MKTDTGNARIWLPHGAIDTFRHSIRSASTANQFNHAIIRYERRMTPGEQAAFIFVLEEDVARNFSHPGIPKRLKKKLRFSTKPPAQNPTVQLCHEMSQTLQRWRRHSKKSANRNESTWARTFVARGLALYQSNPYKPSFSLLIAFTGGAQRLMMATPFFLQAVEGLGVDVLVVWAKRGGNYRHGIHGMGPDLVESLRALKLFVRAREYRDVTVLGVSAGGLPALIFAIAHQRSPFLVVACHDPTESEHAEKWKNILESIDKDFPLPRRQFLVGESAPKKDFDAARYLGKTVGGRIKTKMGGHAPLHLMPQRGTLRPMLRELYDL